MTIATAAAAGLSSPALDPLSPPPDFPAFTLAGCLPGSAVLLMITGTDFASRSRVRPEALLGHHARLFWAPSTWLGSAGGCRRFGLLDGFLLASHALIRGRRLDRCKDTLLGRPDGRRST